MSDRTAYLSRSQDDAQVSYQFQRQQLDPISAYVDKRWGPDTELELLGGAADLTNRFDRFHLTGAQDRIWEGQAAYPWEIPTSANNQLHHTTNSGGAGPAVSSAIISSDGGGGWPTAGGLDAIGSSEHAVSQPIEMAGGRGSGQQHPMMMQRHSMVQSQDAALSPNSKDLIAMGMRIVDQVLDSGSPGVGGGMLLGGLQQQDYSDYNLLQQQQQQQLSGMDYRQPAEHQLYGGSAFHGDAYQSDDASLLASGQSPVMLPPQLGFNPYLSGGGLHDTFQQQQQQQQQMGSIMPYGYQYQMLYQQQQQAAAYKAASIVNNNNAPGRPGPGQDLGGNSVGFGLFPPIFGNESSGGGGGFYGNSGASSPPNDFVQQLLDKLAEWLQQRNLSLDDLRLILQLDDSGETDDGYFDDDQGSDDDAGNNWGWPK